MLKPLFVSHAFITFQRSRQNQQQHYWVDQNGVLPPREYYSIPVGISTTVRTVYLSYMIQLRVHTRKYLRRLRGPTCVAQLPMTIPGRTVPTRQSDTSLCCLYRRCIIAYLNRREGKVRHRHFGGETSRLPLRKYSRNRFLFGWS